MFQYLYNSVTGGRGGWGMGEQLEQGKGQEECMRSGWWHKYRSAKKTLRKSLAVPLHASLHRALFFCSASQTWEKVLKLPELQFILFFKDRLIRVFCQPCSRCTMHFYAWPVKLPKRLPKQSVSSKHLWQQNSSWKSCICVLAKTFWDLPPQCQLRAGRNVFQHNTS